MTKKRGLCLATGLLLAAGCGARSPMAWEGFDQLRHKPTEPSHYLGDTELTPEDYTQVLKWGAEWFRTLTFGNERTMTDAAGLFNGRVEIPCDGPCAPGCTKTVEVLPFFMQAIDDLDGVRGNLFSDENGGPNGKAYTHDLVVRFPKGTRLFGQIPVPEELHTGLDVEAGEPLPIGVVAVPARSDEQDLAHLIDLSKLGVGPAPSGKVRLGLTCALCHYSLDVDWDGTPDLRSARWDVPTPGSKYRPYDAWAIGNQDIHFGWLFSLSANPLLGITVISGPVGPNTQRDARSWMRWVHQNYKVDPLGVKRSVAIGMLGQPRGWADDTPDAVHNPTQFPSLYTHMNWPYNVDGVLVNAGDRNNNVWTAALEFTALVGFAKDRAGKTQRLLFWEERSVYSDFTAADLAEMMLYFAPAVTRASDPNEARKALEDLKDDVLGYRDGVPGLLDPNSVVVMKGLPGVIPDRVYDDPRNDGRRRKPSDYGGDAKYRNQLVGMMGVRVKTPANVRTDPSFQRFLQRYPDIGNDPARVDEMVSDSVSVMLNWTRPPTNHSALLRNSAHLIEKGYEVFKSNGCNDCHRGPFFTDNLIKRFQELGTNDQRAIATRPLQSFVAPEYDPATGEAACAGVFGALSGSRAVGYKTLTLRYVWGSAPYLHDGGVGVALDPAAPPPENDLKKLLTRNDAIYGMGRVLALRESGVAPSLRANAALSLQALVLKAEREKLLRQNQLPHYPIPGLDKKVPLSQLGIEGTGHEYYVDDVPGGDTVSALIAFLLALDDCPGQHLPNPVSCNP